MRNLALLGLVVALTCGATTSQASTIEKLVQSERDFSALSDKEDMRSAFLRFLADDGVVFGKNGVTNGKKTWQERPTPKAKLLWRPSYAGIAASGDLGFTTGPFELTRDGALLQYGWYASVWKLQPDGTWKVLCDLGAQVKRPATEPPDWHTTKVPKPVRPGQAADIIKYERELAARGVGVRALYEQIVADDIVLLRDGVEPVTGRAAAIALQPVERDAISWEPVAGEVSKGRDYAYVYGTYKAGAANGWYMRVWRRDGDSWRVVLESSSAAA